MVFVLSGKSNLKFKKFIMQSLIIIGIRIAIGCSPARNSALINLLINLTGGYLWFCH
jgi:hypothetical protein